LHEFQIGSNCAALVLSSSLGFEAKHGFKEVLGGGTAVWPWQRFPAERAGYHFQRLRTEAIDSHRRDSIVHTSNR
jgi:hypothetical protein